LTAQPLLPALFSQVGERSEQIGFISGPPGDFLPSRARNAKNPGRRSRVPSRHVRGTMPQLSRRESWGRRSSNFRSMPAIAASNRPVRPVTSSWAIPASNRPAPTHAWLALAGYRFWDASRWPEIRGCTATQWPTAEGIPPVARSGRPLRDAASASRCQTESSRWA